MQLGQRRVTGRPVGRRSSRKPSPPRLLFIVAQVLGGREFGAGRLFCCDTASFEILVATDRKNDERRSSEDEPVIALPEFLHLLAADFFLYFAQQTVVMVGHRMSLSFGQSPVFRCGPDPAATPTWRA